uniref:Uncharacterized protein n=1 Tax=Arundo donax TaxID=35708 RepID=A0A0A9F2Q4_ARUDO
MIVRARLVWFQILVETFQIRILSRNVSQMNQNHFLRPFG